ncbi:MAG: hemoglobin/transferrin/lactoferrin receptor protein [Cryomorphaceae bacterium]|jgi:hemoglobin/transferrin/lactoferrin receptor protein
MRQRKSLFPNLRKPQDQPSCHALSKTIVMVVIAQLSNVLMAQEIEAEELEVSTVTGKRTSAAWIDQSFSLATIEIDDELNQQSRSLLESLRYTPGVMIQKTANGHGSPFIRGFTGYRTLALIDGVRYNNSVYRDGPNEYFSLIDRDAFERIELIQGPSSVVFGNDSIGGTLNLITRPTEYLERERFYSKQDYSYRYSSAENSHQARVSYELGVGGDWGLRIGIGGREYGDVKSADIGTQENTGYFENSFDMRFDKSINDLWSFTAVHQQLAQDDVWRTHSTVFGESFAGTSIGSDLRRLKDQHRSLTYLKLNGEIDSAWADDVALNLSYQTWDEDGDRIRGDGRRNEDYFDSRMWGVDLQFQKEVDSVNLTYGLDFYQDKVSSGRTDTSADGLVKTERIQGPVGDDSRYGQLGIYAKGAWSLNERLKLTLGTRFANVDAKVGRYEDPETGVAASYSDEWSDFISSARVSYALDLADTTRLWGGVSQAFRAPNIADISRFGASRSDEIEVAATGLDPENFLSYEVGIKTETDRYQGGLSYYYTYIDDYITSTPTGNIRDGQTEVSKQNSATGYVHGVELFGSYQINDSLSVWGNATWVYGELDSFGKSESEPLSRLAPPTFNAGVKWQSADQKWTAGLAAQLALKADKLNSRDMSDTQRIPEGGTPGYLKADAYVGYTWQENYQFQLGFNNLLDEAYRVHGSGVNEPGFGLNFGLKASF